MSKKKSNGQWYIPLIAIFAITILSIYFINNRLTEKTSMNESETITTLSKTDIVVGTGAEAVKGKTVKVLYIGSLVGSSDIFDQKQDKNDPFSFTLGSGNVIAGWDQGIEGMRVGGKRELLIPPALGYGDNGAGDRIPPGASLKFTVELLAVE